MNNAQTGTPGAEKIPPLYRKVEPLHLDRHANLSIKPFTNFSFVRGLNAAAVTIQEMEAAQRHYPIIFTTEEVPVPVAVMGLTNGENRFVDKDGAWRPNHYIPAYVRRYPFIFIQADKDQLLLGADMDSGRFVEDASQPLFAEGKPTQVLEQAMEFCRAFQIHHLQTQEFGKELRDRGLLTPRTLTVNNPNGTPASMGGFQVIDMAKLAGLSDADLVQWYRKGWLTAAHFHAASQHNWNALAALTP